MPNPAEPQPPAGHPATDLEVAMAVPERGGARLVFVTGPQSHFHGVLRNRSAAPLKLWEPSCSWGYDALRFKAVDAQGRAIEIRRRPGSFLKNLPITFSLGPGEMAVIDVSFASEEWQTFRLPAKGQTIATRMQAIYEAPADEEARKQGAWTGTTSSPLETYR